MSLTASPPSLPAAAPWWPSPCARCGKFGMDKTGGARTLLMRCQSSADSSVNNIHRYKIGQTNDLPRFFPPGSSTHLTWDNSEPRITKTQSFCPVLLGDWNVLVLYVAAAAINADITKDRYQFYISSEFPLVLETKVIRMFPKISQSRRRPLLGPSPGWKRLLPLSHLRHY